MPTAPENPFASAGTADPGQGWVARPARLEGERVHRREDADPPHLALSAEPGARPPTVVCHRRPRAVAGRVWAGGRWRLHEVVPGEPPGGAEIQLLFTDAEGRRLAGREGKVQVAVASGTRPWTEVRSSFAVPDSAAGALLCVDLRGVRSGRVDLAEMGLFRPTGTQGTGGDAGPPHIQWPHILWVVVDALRADHLSPWSEQAPPTPHLDRFARRAWVPPRTWTAYTWTGPSYVSYMTSRHARTHGWAEAWTLDSPEPPALVDPTPTLAEVLSEHGYATHALNANALLDGVEGLDRGFDHWTSGPDAEITARACEDLADWGRDGVPHFLYVHLMATHQPLCPTAEARDATGVELDTALLRTPSPACPEGGLRSTAAEYADRGIDPARHRRAYRDAYRASVWDADHRFGQMLAALEASGQADRTVVVFTSDHGELLGEHDAMGHGPHVWEPLASVPLLVAGPGWDAPPDPPPVARLVDLPPTLLSLAGLSDAVPTAWQGRAPGADSGDRLAVCERGNLRASTQDGRYKLVLTTADGAEGSVRALYDLREDPGELRSLHRTAPRRVEALRAADSHWLQATPAGAAAERTALSPDERRERRRRLETLGYLQGDVP